MQQEMLDILSPYEVIERDDIQYTYCRNYEHISRYKGLRQVVHQGFSPQRYIALETGNPIEGNVKVSYLTVPANLENRLDIIAQRYLGSASYAWILAYFNGIADGFTLPEGTKLAIPESISSLFESGEILAPVSATLLNLGSE